MAHIEHNRKIGGCKMTPEELLKKLQTKELAQYEDEKTGMTIRYYGGKFQLLCSTCSGEKWDNISDAYAVTLSKKFMAK